MNKKLIKTIASLTCGLGIVSVIPFISTSCAEDKKIEIPDPTPTDRVDYQDDIFKVDANGNCTGFVDDFDATSEQYKNCNTLYFPKKIKSFTNNPFESDRLENAKIDKKITNIIFANDSEVQELPSFSFFGFNNRNTNYIELPKSLKKCGNYTFGEMTADVPMNINFKCNTGGIWNHKWVDETLPNNTKLYFTDFNDFKNIEWKSTKSGQTDLYPFLKSVAGTTKYLHIYTPNLKEKNLEEFKIWVKDYLANVSDEIFDTWTWN